MTAAKSGLKVSPTVVARPIFGNVIEADLTWTGKMFERGVRIACGPDGAITAMSRNLPESSVTLRLRNQALLPGMISAHSHCFHRALRGRNDLTVRNPGSGAAQLNFWSWRSEMYKLAASLTEEDLYLIARQTFEEMLQSGITAVGEFHYLHHPYEADSPARFADESKMYSLDRVVLRAAKDAKIRIVLLETYYQRAGMSSDQSSRLEPTQKRFYTATVEEFWKNMDRLEQELDKPMQSLGVAAHSVRAVPTEKLFALHSEAEKRKFVFHMHLEEQPQEIADCVAATKMRPSEIVLNNISVNERFTAVHCTHTSPKDLLEFTRRGANVCVCPLTEGNLADGIHSLPEQPLRNMPPLQVCFGTDCNQRICMAEEMRWFVQLQQLKTGRRGLAMLDEPNLSIALFRYATQNGARSLGLARCGSLGVGQWLDFFAINLGHPALANTTDGLLDAFVFGTAPEALITASCAGGYLREYNGGIYQVSTPSPNSPLRSNDAVRLDGSSVARLAYSLMAIESVTGNEALVTATLAGYLETCGWQVYRQTLEGQPPERFNLLATRGKKFDPYPLRSPRLLLNSHLDTVPPFIAPSFDPSGTLLRGRGACDAKGMVAAMIFAAEKFCALEGNQAQDVALLFVVGEETDHLGMIEANKLGLAPEFLICGEPTQLKLAERQKGILKFQLISDGTAAHSGYPEKGRSAMEPLLDVLQDLRSTKWPSSQELGKTTLNIGIIRGGEAANVLPEHAEATLLFRVVTDAASLMAKVKEVVADRVIIKPMTANNPVDLCVVDGFDSAIVAFNTDIPYFKPARLPQCFLFGAGSITDAHTANEFVAVSDLEISVERYVTLMRKLLL